MKKVCISIAIAMAMAAAIPLGAVAASRAEVLKQVESSLLVTGTIDTHADGTVSATVIDKPEKLPKGVVALVQKEAAGWRFEPVLVDGRARPTRSAMSVRVIAKRIDEDSFSIGIRSANFGGSVAEKGEVLSSIRLTPPPYPSSVASSGASGVVYLIVKVGKDGRVSDTIVEQVNLQTIGSESQMAAWRAALSASAVRATRKWTFAVPTRGEQVDDEYWTARVPVAFYMHEKFTPAYGKWETYLPGVRQSVPWSQDEQPGFSPDTLAAGGVYMMGGQTGPKLLTPLEGS